MKSLSVVVVMGSVVGVVGTIVVDVVGV